MAVDNNSYPISLGPTEKAAPRKGVMNRERSVAGHKALELPRDSDNSSFPYNYVGPREQDCPLLH